VGITRVWIKTRIKPRWIPHVLVKTCAKGELVVDRDVSKMFAPAPEPSKA